MSGLLDETRIVAKENPIGCIFALSGLIGALLAIVEMVMAKL